ncbi:hypothetical protein SCLCIDRAFT_22648 [Scleroderma citrinum Foug A]|uniref:Uncharacterized protein n=1 Tax=Scleroderma citrinum Foug A TaxID=1036808 RepID=A0A0C3DXZ6_9AGAM|nr:hypothetical protein SCLCIDRAFT_22648 [Scleroderma citrinum Foug A]
MDLGQAGIPEADTPNLAIPEHRTEAEEHLATPSLPEPARESDKVYSLPIINPDTDNSFGKAGLSVPREDNFTRPVETILHGSNPFHPYPNETSLLLGDWYWNEGHQKSQSSFRKLLDIIGHPEYRPEDVQNTNWTAIDQKLGSSSIGDETGTDCEWLDVDSGWKKSDICICIPFHRRTGNPGSKEYVVKDFHYRSLVEIIRENLCWHPPHKTRDVRVYGELYASESFLAAHCQLQDSPPENGYATHLTAFGMAKLWPLYVYMGNELKYMCCRPLSNLCSHAAYFRTLPDAFKDFAAENSGGNALGDNFFTHSHRELFHAQWKILLDDEFIEAHHHGIVCQCYDGIYRRLYPHIFTYSADYPEKVLIATIHNMGECLCPRCLIPKSRVHQIATARDILHRKVFARCDTKERRDKVATARQLIYEKHYAVHTPQFEELLKDKSLVPTLNAFSERLGATGFDLFRMLVVDLLHEFELGVWKAIFTHLLRLLDAAKQNMVHELDHRYRAVPTFGHDTIRHFRSNSSEMKKMAARDFEDLLLACTRCIRSKLAALRTAQMESLANNPEDRYHIGQTQNFLEDLILFVGKNSDDPFTKNFILRLKAHLLPCARALHQVDVFADLSGPPVTVDTPDAEDLSTLNQVIFHKNHIYRHHLFQVNYTTYDVRHAQDTINPCTDHRDVMLLAPLQSAHPFLYAHVLGIFHANDIYTGQGSKDYLPRHMEFLWVRWFEVVDVPAGWEHTALDRLRFVPTVQDDAYGFVEPASVLRGCHLIPAFASGKIHPDGVLPSRSGREADWKHYYVNRFVDRDMLLRYHWGQGIGHAYSHLTWTEVDPHDDPIPTLVNSHNSDNFKPGRADDQVEIPDTPDDWEDVEEDSNNSESGESIIDQDEGWRDSEEEVLIATLCELELVHPGIDVLEYDDYRY